MQIRHARQHETTDTLASGTGRRSESRTVDGQARTPRMPAAFLPEEIRGEGGV